MGEVKDVGGRENLSAGHGIESWYQGGDFS